MEPTRKFKIIINSKECGTCSGSSQSTVAKKVIKKLCGKSNKTVKFSLKEYKRGCVRVCGPYQGRMEKLDRPCKRGGKTITHRVVCGKVRKMRGGVKNENFGIELQEITERDLDIDDFKLPYPIRNYFEIKYIGPIPYLFLHSNEIDISSTNNKNFNQYKLNYKFAISNNCNIFMYKNGKIILLDNHNLKIKNLKEIGLFNLLNQESEFINEKNVSKTGGKIIDMIKMFYPEFKDIIECLRKLHLMYKRNERNEKYIQYMRNRPPIEI